MRVLLQRVSEAAVKISGESVGEIQQGFLILLGIATEDDTSDVDYLIQKIVQMRVFSDADGKMNLNVQDVQGELLIVSQFTLHASTKKGNRPSYIKAAKGDFAKNIYDKFLIKIKSKINKEPKAGIFGADMLVKIENDGPVTIFMDSKNKSL